MGVQSDAIRAALTSATEAVVIALVLEIGAELRKNPDAGGTPVKTGHARRNWVASVGGPFLEEVDDSSAAEAGDAAVLAYRLIDGPAFLANNASYINLLDLGLSDQAAAGFVEVCIAVAMETTQAQFQQVDIGIAGYRGAVGGGAAENLASAYSPFGGDGD